MGWQIRVNFAVFPNFIKFAIFVTLDGLSSQPFEQILSNLWISWRVIVNFADVANFVIFVTLGRASLKPLK